MALALIAEALARVEHKIDLLLRNVSLFSEAPYARMGFYGTTCPVCTGTVEYQIDMIHNVVVRKCGCTSGKVPSIIPLTPIGDLQNAKPDAGQARERDRYKRPTGRPGSEEG